MQRLLTIIHGKRLLSATLEPTLDIYLTTNVLEVFLWWWTTVENCEFDTRKMSGDGCSDLLAWLSIYV